MKKTLHYMLTGATGLLGRNLLFEIIKQHLDDLTRIKIFVLGRAGLAQRIFEIIGTDGMNYLSLDKGEQKGLLDALGAVIHCLHFDLESYIGADEQWLQQQGVDFFFHVAAHTDFRSSEAVKKKLWSVNVDGTHKVLDLARRIRVAHFIYTGSAYACGDTTGRIEPDYINFDQSFRNPYELSKLEAEVSVRRFTRRHGIKATFFRPSTICGRLIEKEIGAVSKFDVFYAWMFFFLRCKERMYKENDLDKTAFMPCRVAYNPESGLNIVPADYAAKAMYRLTLHPTGTDSFHLVNTGETKHDCYIPAMTTAIGMEGMQHVAEPPLMELNELETMYYKTVGAIFTPYITSAPMEFAVPGAGEPTAPAVDAGNFDKLLAYALDNRHGVTKN
ncbi:SDR family oxidoreductase [Dinghuibacter silviterrae]|uniref:Male sterility protein n=1 Tax=Dinghuibacter silviterrae TaxID=1539049 RepID=A0A4R8DV75_9BACT|nr:SDR family oxidoreductase [Dinghuibacter silviterrae]TDX02089.1 male sterility protein [Dinghuibacter silviterrae]